MEKMYIDADLEKIVMELTESEPGKFYVRYRGESLHQMCQESPIGYESCDEASSSMQRAADKYGENVDYEVLDHCYRCVFRSF